MKMKLEIPVFFNVDETSHAVVQRPEKNTAQKCKHQVGAFS
jgi:hypothetical protein